MSKTYKKLQIDVNKDVTDIITAVQNDSNSRYLDVVILDGSEPFNFTDENVKIYMKKPDGTEIFNNGVITEAANGRCQFELTSQALANVGVLKTQISVWKNNTEILSTKIFNIFVTESLISSSSIESSNEYGALVVLFQNLYESMELMMDMVNNFGTAGSIAESIPATTFWKMLETIYSVNKEALENASVLEVLNRLGVTTDTGGSSTAGTVMGKLNSISKNAKKAYVWDGGKTKTSLSHISGYDGNNTSKVLVLSDCFVPEYDGIIQIGLTGTIGNAPSSAGIHGIGWSSIDANGDKNAQNTVKLPYMIYAKGTVISYGSSGFPSDRGAEKLWQTPTTNGEINLTAFLKVSKGAQLNIFSFPYTENVTISDVFVKYDIKEV